MSRLLLVSALCGIVFASSVAIADDSDVDYSKAPQVPALLQKLRIDDRFSEAELQNVTAALADARRLPQLIVQEQKAPERTETWRSEERRVGKEGVSTCRDRGS